jgi:hypothetical protein
VSCLVYVFSIKKQEKFKLHWMIIRAAAACDDKRWQRDVISWMMKIKQLELI